MQDGPEFVPGGARGVGPNVDHDAGDPLPLMGAHQLGLVMFAGETFLEHDRGHVSGEAGAAANELGSVPAEGEVVGVAGVAGAGRAGEPGETAIEAKGDGIRQGWRGGRALGKMGQAKPLARFPGKAAAGCGFQYRQGSAVAAESGEQGGDLAGIAHAAKE